MSFRRQLGSCLSSTVRNKSQYWFAFSTDENSEALESSSINDGYVPISPVYGRRLRDRNIDVELNAIMV